MLYCFQTNCTCQHDHGAIPRYIVEHIIQHFAITGLDSAVLETETRAASYKMLACLNVAVQLSPISSPTIDLGRDFEILIRKCISEKQAQAEINSALKNEDITEFFEDIKTENEKTEACIDGFNLSSETKKTDIWQSSKFLRQDDSDKDDISTGNEIDFPSLRNVYKLRKISNKTCDSGLTTKKTKKKLGARKKDAPRKTKWSKAPGDILGLEFSLLPRRTPVSEVTESMIEQEYEKFKQEFWPTTRVAENKFENITKTHTGSSNQEGKIQQEICARPTNDSLCSRQAKTEDVSCNSKNFDKIIEEWQFYEEDLMFGVENKVPLRVLQKCENIAYLGHKKRCRVKHKWHTEKARLQIKTKQCKHLDNWPHGKTLYIKHRLAHVIANTVRKMTYLPSKRKLKDIDAKSVNCASNTRGYVASNNSYNSNQRRNPAYAMNAYNADGDLTADLVNVLINLQNRDLTPEDYDILLRLDERVKPKTLDKNTLNTFKTEPVSDDNKSEHCTVCMESYQLGQIRKILPCGHAFHTDCIEMWLKTSSLNCPLDGLSVQEW